MTKLRATLLLLPLLVLLSAVACGSSGRPTTPGPASGITEAGESSPAAFPTAPQTTAPDSGPVVPPPAEPAASSIAGEQQAISIMWQVLDRSGLPDEGVIAVAGLNGHPGLVPVLVEAAGRTFDPGVALTIARALERITGERVGGDFVLVGPWYSWMGRQDPPQQELDGFDQWKGEILGSIDPSFTQFIYKDVPTRIPLWTIQWGGVLRDGIPPLEFPKTVPASEVTFLLPDEPVFGVTINGESRAYPHRIMGWHELANDVLGGQLITFVF